MILIWKWFVAILFIPLFVACFIYGLMVGAACAINGRTKEDALRELNKIGVPIQDFYDAVYCCFD